MSSAGSTESRGSNVRLPRQTYNVIVLSVFLSLAGLWAGGCGSPSQSSLEETTQVQPVAESSSTQGTGIETIQAVQPASVPDSPPNTPSSVAPNREISLFDGKTLGLWKPTDFGGQGNVYVKDGVIYMEMGNYMTGITWTGPVVRENYEISLEAMRVEGNDFFCGLTFPVGDKPCTLVLGGWGGSVCGLSTIDYFDASENETTRIISFERGKWYHVRLRVEGKVIQVWLDDEELVNFDTTDHKIGIRAEVDLSQPLGIATWITTGAVRDIRLRTLPEQ